MKANKKMIIGSTIDDQFAKNEPNIPTYDVNLVSPQFISPETGYLECIATNTTTVQGVKNVNLLMNTNISIHNVLLAHHYQLHNTLEAASLAHNKKQHEDNDKKYTILAHHHIIIFTCTF